MNNNNIKTCPREHLDEFVRNGQYHEDYETYKKDRDSWVKPFIVFLYVIVFCLVACMCFMVGRIWEKYDGVNNFLKSKSEKKIEYNTKDYKLYKNYKYII